MKKRQAGFTLIELIVVIIIIGILAATALPKFMNLQNEARRATLEGAYGSARAASAIAHSGWLAQTAGDAAQADATIDMEGSDVTMCNGYPTADDAGIIVAAGITTGADGDYITEVSGSTVFISPQGVQLSGGAVTKTSCRIAVGTPANKGTGDACKLPGNQQNIVLTASDCS